MSGNPQTHTEQPAEQPQRISIEFPQDFRSWAPFLDLSASLPEDLGEIILIDLLGNYSEQTGANFG